MIYRRMIYIKDKKLIQLGQSLVEVLMALGVAAMLLSAITVVVVSSLRNAKFSENQNRASQYALQGMEIIRQIRDEESNLDKYQDTFYCLGEGASLTRRNPGCGANIGKKDIGSDVVLPDIYKREAEIWRPVEEDEKKVAGPSDGNKPCKNDTYYVAVSVSWWDNACSETSDFCHKAKIVSCLAKRVDSQKSLRD